MSAPSRGLCQDNVTARDLFDTKLMGALTPFPREVHAAFRARYAQDPAAATDWYYQLVVITKILCPSQII